jgi:hypothetical protein
VHISKRLALTISGGAFVGAAALGLGAAAPAGAAVSTPTQGVTNQLFCGGGGGWGGGCGGGCGSSCGWGGGDWGGGGFFFDDDDDDCD